MSQPRNASVIVVTETEDDVEALNQTLRRAGFAARCQWVRDGDSFAKQVSADTDLVVMRIGDGLPDVGQTVAMARKRECRAAIVAVCESFDEAAVSAAIDSGAADLVTLEHTVRLSATLKRELDLQMLYSQVASSRSNVATIQQQFTTLMDNVPDAIAHVQEGIIVETNKAWLELFGYEDDNDCVALPLMDAIAPRSQSAIKGALKAISRGKWKDEPLDVNAVKAGGQNIDLTLLLTAAQFDGEPAVRVAVKPEEKEDKRVSSLMRDAMTKDQSTFLYHRKHFLKLVGQRVAENLDAGVRMLAWIRIDNFKDVRRELGVIDSEDVIAEFAELLRRCVVKGDIPGRFEGTAFTILMERATDSEARVWAEKFAALVADQHFEVGDRTITLTCSVGIAAYGELIDSVPALVEAAEKTYTAARKDGRGSVRIAETSDEDTRIRNHDALWAKRLTSALKENRFRLLKQPIAALDGEAAGVFDILMRLVDEQGETIAPSEFLPAARRNNMMQALDRWVIGASIAMSREQRPDLLFVRISEQSVTDRSFAPWLKTIVAKSDVSAKSLCFQVTEEVALNYLKAVMQTAAAVRAMGCQFALEHVGNSPQSVKLVNGIPLDFAKIDGALITNLSTDSDAHTTTGQIVEAARSRGVRTVAEKVQDANTMAALWQLGISFMQGHYVQEPEVVLQDTA